MPKKINKAIRDDLLATQDKVQCFLSGKYMRNVAARGTYQLLQFREPCSITPSIFNFTVRFKTNCFSKKLVNDVLYMHRQIIGVSAKHSLIEIIQGFYITSRISREKLSLSLLPMSKWHQEKSKVSFKKMDRPLWTLIVSTPLMLNGSWKFGHKCTISL